MKKLVLFVSLALFSDLSSARIYKWVDENGVTQYSQTKPPSADAEQMRVDTDAPKEPPQHVKDSATTLAKDVVLKDHGDSKNLDCDKAVFNAKDSIDTMLTVGEKNHRSGYMSDAEYRTVSAKLRGISRSISKAECSSATGDVRGFYLCMANDYNHVAMCGEKYGYGE